MASIGFAAFAFCSNLLSINIPSSVTSIGTGAFYRCKSLTSITIPSSVVSVNNFTFQGCINLKTVNITSNITSIGTEAFENCNKLLSITIPSSVTSIGSNAFSGCNSLTSVIYLGSNDPDSSGDSSLNQSKNLKFVCVSASYNNNSFCGFNHFCKHESCDSFLRYANQCYEPVCNENNAISIERRNNATKWESRSNGCYEFHCYNDSGPIYWKNCNRTGEICENGQCVSEKEEVTYSVEIDVDRLNVTDINMNELQDTISNLTNVEEDKIRIQVDTNDNDEIVRIIVTVVDDDEATEKISESINAVINDGLCQ